MAAVIPMLRVISVSMWEERSTRASMVFTCDNSLRRRWSAAGGGMRLGEVAFVAEVGHHVTNGGGTQVVTQALGDGTRGYRFAVLDVGFDDRMQDVLFAAGHISKGALLIDYKGVCVCGQARAGLGAWGWGLGVGFRRILRFLCWEVALG